MISPKPFMKMKNAELSAPQQADSLHLLTTPSG